MKKALLAVLLASIVAVYGIALSISTDHLELRVQERSGRFSLYAIHGDGTRESLFFENDPRTTVLTVLAGNRTYRMGDSFEFRQAVSGEGDSASITWSSPLLTVTQTFTLQGASLTIDVRVHNNSEQDLRIGVRYLFDTHLGQKDEHFTVDDLSVQTETEYLRATANEIASSDGKNTQLVILTGGSGITEPDRIVLANWKRLNDTPWSFQANQRRDFNLLPYSIHDSAVALYYEPQMVPRNAARSISIRMKHEDPSKVVPPSRDERISAIPLGESMQLREDIRTEMIKIDSLIMQINALLKDGKLPSQAAFDDITNSLNDLESRAKELTEQ